MSKIFETTIELNAALGRQYAQTFAAAQKLTNGYDKGLIKLQTTAANASGLASLGGEIQKLSSEMQAAGEGTDEQKNKLRYLMSEYNTLSKQLNGSVVAFSKMTENAQKLTDAFERQEIAAKDLAQAEQSLGDVKKVIAQRKEVERLKKLYEKMPNKQLEKDIKAQEGALSRLEKQTGLTGRSMEQLEKRQKMLGAQSTWKKFQASAVGSLKTAAKYAASLAKVIGGVIAAATTAAGVMANETGQKLEETEQRARQFGMNTDIFQGFEYSMKKNGVEREQYMDGLQTLQERMVEAAKEPGEMRDNFKKLGISMKDLKSMNVGQVFQKMAGNAHMLKTEAEQTKMGLDMLGGEGGKIMAAMANDGLAGLQKDFDEARRMGAIATQEQIQNALKYQGQVAKMGAAWEGVKMTIGNAVMPVIISLMEKVGKWLDENPDAIQKVGDAISSVIDDVKTLFLTYVIPYIGPTIDFFKEWGPTILAVGAAVGTFIGIIKAVTLATALWNAVILLNPMVMVIAGIVAAVVAATILVIKYWDKIKAAFDLVVSGIKKGVSSAVAFVSSAVDSIVGFFLSIPDKISSIGSTIAKFFSGIGDGIKNTFKSMINWVISKINGLSFTVPDWVPEIGGQTIGANIPLLASGGIATKPTQAIIGEGSEPEAVLPLSKLKSLLQGNSGAIGGMNVHITQNISVGGGVVPSDLKQAAASGAQDLAAQIDAIMKRKYRLAM